MKIRLAEKYTCVRDGFARFSSWTAQGFRVTSFRYSNLSDQLPNRSRRRSDAVEMTGLKVLTRTLRHVLAPGGFTYDEAAELRRQAET